MELQYMSHFGLISCSMWYTMQKLLAGYILPTLFSYFAFDFFVNRMQRNRGQFTSSKSKPEDAGAGITRLDASQRWGSVEGRPESSAT